MVFNKNSMLIELITMNNTDVLKLKKLRVSLSEALKSSPVLNFSKENFLKEMHIKYQTNKTLFEKP